MSEPLWKLTIYEEDDVSVWTDCTTDPAGSRPYLKPIVKGIQAEIDLVKGSASIGTIDFSIVDKRITPADQDTGWFTAKLATVDGDSALMGRRALLERDIGSGYETIFEGVISSIKMDESIVTYNGELKDTRERERNIRLFTKSNTASLIPKGLALGYGQLQGTSNYLIPPVDPYVGDWEEWATGYGTVLIDSPTPVIEYDRQMQDFGRAVPMYDADGSYLGYGYPDVTVRWRPAIGGAWTEFENMKSQENRSLFITVGSPYNPGTSVIVGIWINDPDTPANLPADDQSIDFQVLSNIEPNKEFPVAIEDTAGQLLKDIYDGEYSEQDPKIRYDSARMAELITDTPVVRALIYKTVDNLQEWVRKNIYQPLGLAPALSADGEIYPISSELPDENETLKEFSNTVVQPVIGWEQSTRDAITLVEVIYQRDFIPEAVRKKGIKKGIEWRIPENVHQVEVKHEVRSSASLLIGDKPLKIEAETLRANGGYEGEPISGDVRDELGAKLAQVRAREVLDRFRYGGQRFNVKGRLSLIDDVLPGSWGYVSASWLPEYSTGERGANRLVQVIGITDLDPDWRELQLIDAGAQAQPIAQPTLDTVTVDDEGIVSVPITGIPAGGEARIDYAINATEPDADSGLWLFLGRSDSTVTLKTPPLPFGLKVWIRARGEAEGRRRSAWINAVSIIIPSTPVVTDGNITLELNTNISTVTWTPNAHADGVRIYYKVHLATEDPGTLTLFQDVDASLGTYEFSAVPVDKGYAFSIEIEPWDTFPIAGNAGPRVILTESNQEGFVYPRPSPPSNVVLDVVIDIVDVVD